MPTGPRPLWPEGVVRLAFSGTFIDTAWTNVMYAALSGYAAMLEGDLDLWLDAVIAAFDTSHFWHYQSTDLHVTELRGELHQAGGVVLVSERGADISGIDDGSSADANTAAVISWQIRQMYRGGRPRTYLAGLAAEEESTARLLSSSYVDNLHDAANDTLSAFNAIDHAPPTGQALGTVSFQSHGEWRDPPIFRKYWGAVVHPRIATQRRRLGAWLP